MQSMRDTMRGLQRSVARGALRHGQDAEADPVSMLSRGLHEVDARELARLKTSVRESITVRSPVARSVRP